MNDNPFSTEWNDDAAEYEAYLASQQEPRCWLCGGSGYVPDIFGDAEPCDECGDDADAVVEAIVPEPGMPF